MVSSPSQIRKYTIQKNLKPTQHVIFTPKEPGPEPAEAPNHQPDSISKPLPTQTRTQARIHEDSERTPYPPKQTTTHSRHASAQPPDATVFETVANAAIAGLNAPRHVEPKPILRMEEAGRTLHRAGSGGRGYGTLERFGARDPI